MGGSGILTRASSHSSQPDSVQIARGLGEVGVEGRGEPTPSTEPWVEAAMMGKDCPVWALEGHPGSRLACSPSPVALSIGQIYSGSPK